MADTVPSTLCAWPSCDQLTAGTERATITAIPAIKSFGMDLIVRDALDPAPDRFLKNSSMNVGRRRLFRGAVIPAEEPLGLDLLPDFGRRPRRQPANLLDFTLADAREMPDEVDQMPCGFLALPRSSAPARHTGEPDAVLDDPEQLAVGQILR